MAEEEKQTGRIGWIDLTVLDATATRDFYGEIAGWTPEPVAMGNYSDFLMKAPGSDQPLAGICHARGENADLPALWLIHITVENLDDSLERCIQLGGRVITQRKKMGTAQFCVIQDPAGAFSVLYQPNP